MQQYTTNRVNPGKPGWRRDFLLSSNPPHTHGAPLPAYRVLFRPRTPAAAVACLVYISKIHHAIDNGCDRMLARHSYCPLISGVIHVVHSTSQRHFVALSLCLPPPCLSVTVMPTAVHDKPLPNQSKIKARLYSEKRGRRTTNRPRPSPCAYGRNYGMRQCRDILGPP